MVRATIPAVVLLILLTGCAGPAAPGGGSPSSVSPAPVPTTAPAPTERPRLAPGVTAAGIVDPLRLSEAHDRFLENRSETIHLTRTNRYLNGTLHDRTVQVTTVGPGRDRFHTIVTVEGPNARFFGPGGRAEYWSDGDRMLQWLVRNDQSSYAVVEPEDYEPQLSRPLIPSPGGGQVYFLATLGSYRLTDRSVRNGTDLYRFESTRISQLDALAASESVRDPRNVTVILVIDEHGVLRRFVLEYTADRGGTTLSVRLTGEHRDIGDTVVDRPRWYDRAINATG